MAFIPHAIVMAQGLPLLFKPFMPCIARLPMQMATFKKYAE
jgi:hypothetical protein